MMTVQHVSLVLRDADENVIDIFDVDPDHTITDRQLREIVHAHGAAIVERITTTERRPS